MQIIVFPTDFWIVWWPSVLDMDWLAGHPQKLGGRRLGVERKELAQAQQALERQQQSAATWWPNCSAHASQ
jgi:hypothetical protein